MLQQNTQPYPRAGGGAEEDPLPGSFPAVLQPWGPANPPGAGAGAALAGGPRVREGPAHPSGWRVLSRDLEHSRGPRAGW